MAFSIFGKLKAVDKILSAFVGPVKIEVRKCVRQRNKRADCNNCSAVCPVSAVSADAGGVRVDGDKCVKCGRCANVCKAGVFSFSGFSESAYCNALTSGSADAGYVVIACSECGTGDDSTVTVPCLAYVGAGELLLCAASGAGKVVLRHSDCSACPKRGGADGAAELITSIRKIAEGFNPEIRFVVSSDKERSSLNGKNIQVLSRRDFFRHMTQRTKNSAIAAVNSFESVKETEKVFRPEAAGEHAGVPLKVRMLNFALCRILTDEMLKEPLVKKWVSVKLIEKEKCSLCGVCYKLCPTGALAEISENAGEFIRKAGISFDKSKCTDCGTCVSVCTAGALRKDDILSAEEFRYSLRNVTELLHI